MTVVTKRSELRLAHRTTLIEASGIRRMFELSAQLEDPVNFSIGQAHFDTPDPIKEAAIRAIRDGKNGYTVTQGLPELNRALRERIEARDGRDPGDGLITAGVSGGLMLAFMALLDPEDELLVPDPYFVMYNHLASMVGAKAVTYDLYPDWKIREEALEAAVTPKTRAILLNSPHNPTGHVASVEELDAVARVADRHGLLVISDEIYESFVYDAPYTSVGSRFDQVLILGGFSKSYGAAGWRLGFAFGSPNLIDAMRTLQQFSFVCAPTPLQHAALAAIDYRPDEHVAKYCAKRDRLVAGLKDHFDCVSPGGSFYAFPSLPAGVSGARFVESAFDEQMLIVPGSAFSARDTHFRISFAVTDEVLERGIEILCGMASNGSKGV